MANAVVETRVVTGLAMLRPKVASGRGPYLRKENRHAQEIDVRGRDTRAGGDCDRGLCAATGDEYGAGARTLSARVHQRGRSDPAQELALVGLRGIAVDSGWSERQ